MDFSPQRAAEVWEPLYAAGGHDNLWPWDAIVTFLSQAERHLATTRLRILEVGCGTGSNLAAAMVRGHSVAGIDASATAVSKARARLGDASSVDLQVGDFTRLPWPEASFDIVLDRGALYCAAPKELRKAISAIAHVLRPGGLFFFNPYSATHSDSRFAVEEEVGLLHLDAADSGMFKGLGSGTFVSPQGAQSLFPSDTWMIISLREVITSELSEPGFFYPHGEGSAELRVVVQRV